MLIFIPTHTFLKVWGEPSEQGRVLLIKTNFIQFFRCAGAIYSGVKIIYAIYCVGLAVLGSYEIDSNVKKLYNSEETHRMVYSLFMKLLYNILISIFIATF